MRGNVHRRLGLARGEGRLVFLMGALVAVLLAAYTLAKVLRDALFLEEFGAMQLPSAYVAVAIGSAGYVWLESRLARRLTQAGTSRFNQYAAIGFSVLAAVFLPRARHATAAAYYLWTGSQALMLIPHFWGLALDVWDSRRARRLFPVFTGFGLVGGLAGGGIAAAAAPVIQQVGLMWVVSGLLILSSLLTGLVERHRASSHAAGASAGPKQSSWEIIRQSGYIKVMALGLALSVVVGTLVDFQFKLLIQQMYPDPHRLTQFLGSFYVGLNAVSLLLQFGAAGWLFQRLGLAASTILQPGAVLVFAAGAAVTGGGWGVVALRWVQGVIAQTLGKSSSEIYYAAIHPLERRRIKTAIDTIVERWSDALAGAGLIVALRALHVPMGGIIAATGVLAAVWMVVLVVLDRRYGGAFKEALSRRWIEPESDDDSLRLPGARRALVAALTGDDERQVLAALRLAARLSDAATGLAVRRALAHSSHAVRAAAIDAMTARRLSDPQGTVEGLVGSDDEAVRRAAVAYLISRGAASDAAARAWLEGDDPAMRDYVLDALIDHPGAGRQVVDPEWVEARLASERPEELLVAARALSVMDHPQIHERLGRLLTHPDAEIRRAALVSAAKRPSADLLPVMLPLLAAPDVSDEARDAIAAVGDPAIPALSRLLSGESGERAQERAARTLAKIARPRAVASLFRLVRGGDARLRYVGLKGLALVRVRTGQRTLPRRLVHRIFVRDLREYRKWSEPVPILAPHPAPEVRLLAESYRESADHALERALLALACWYDPKPLLAVYDKLRSVDPAAASPALEYLGHVLPRRVFQPVSEIFEAKPMEPTEAETEADPVARWIDLAWEAGDSWLRACAVRASRCVPGFDRARFTGGGDADALVQGELAALAESP